MTIDMHSTVTLNNGVVMPRLGFGVFQVEPGSTTTAAVKAALAAGYRSIDTASLYANESDVGLAVRESGLNPDEIFITTKVWNDAQGRGPARASFEASERRLGRGVIDLFLIHWPQPKLGLYVETWHALVELLEETRVPAIGVSNFLPHHLATLIDSSDVVPSVNQIEMHPHLQQAETLAFCNEHGIVVEAWSPLKRGEVTAIEELIEIGAGHGKSAAQVTLRWLLQLGVVVIPRSINEGRIAENADLYDFELSDEEMAAIAALDRNERIGPHPDHF